MLSQLLPLLCLVASGDAPPAKDVQRDGVAAIWLAPMLVGKTWLPLAGQVGVQLGPWAMITASYGKLPADNVEASGWTVGARWFLREEAFAPFLAVESGAMSQRQDDTGGRSDNYAFATIGAGFEQVWAHHFSFSADLQAGPGRREVGSYHDATWLFWQQVRVALGLRF